MLQAVPLQTAANLFSGTPASGTGLMVATPPSTLAPQSAPQATTCSLAPGALAAVSAPSPALHACTQSALSPCSPLMSQLYPSPSSASPLPQPPLATTAMSFGSVSQIPVPALPMLVAEVKEPATQEPQSLQQDANAACCQPTGVQDSQAMTDAAARQNGKPCCVSTTGPGC
jgi:hypothetical protein